MSALDRHAVALVLAEIGTLLELQGENRFKVRAYAGAARALEEASESLEELIGTGALAGLPGIGPATRAVVEELAATGQSRYHAELRDRTPVGLLELLRVPGLGPSKVRALHDELDIRSVDDLERAAAAGRLSRVKGFGQRVQASVLEGVAFVRATSGRRLISGADRAAGRFAESMRSLDAVLEVAIAGTVRRREELHREAVLVVSAETTDAPRVVDVFLAQPALSSGRRASPSEADGRLADGFAVRLVVVPPGRFALALLRETGTREHFDAFAARATLAGLELRGGTLLDPAGAEIGVDSEEDAYSAIGLAWVPPELREGLGETDLAAEGALPMLLETRHLRGCFHNHTTWSDGAASVVDMARAALARGWRYLGIADHSRAAAYAGGLGPDQIARQREEIDEWNAGNGEQLWLFQGIEADILPDGRLDLADAGDALEALDYVVASVHSSFGLEERAQTERILSALAHPAVTFLGHATGRRLLQREGYRVDLEAILQYAAAAGVAVEINASPRRLDLPWRWWHRARVLGVETAVNPDAHSTAELDYVRFGVDVARKGWLDPAAVWNTLEVDDVRDRFRRRGVGKNR
ncbi:MAG TPA: helix-hairpin-helix domain-containing protein [Longimicrobiales bacterium]|nr:helix-hairpin-helix domain-containing protein [Longimicrobiales bacterium]